MDLAKIKSAFTASRKAASTLGSNLDEVRQHIATLKDERAQIEGHQPELATALARVDAFAAHLRHPLDDFYIGHFAVAGKFTMPDVLARDRLALAGCADLVADALKAKLKAFYTDRGDGISESDRQARLQEIDKQLLDLELLEEASIREAERAGFELMRRPDANPLAVLAADEALPK